MSQVVTLYAWAIPTEPGLPDHTWVTDYDCLQKNRPPDLNAVNGQKKHYWFCCDHFKDEEGELVYRFHSGAEPNTRCLGAMPAILERAIALVTPNEPWLESACGTIQTYGHDGTCHQIANQVLAATGWGTDPSSYGAYMDVAEWGPLPLVPPLTVQGAFGYAESVFVYGVYGRAVYEWKDLLAQCLGQDYGAVPGSVEHGRKAQAVAPSAFVEKEKAEA